MSMFKRIKTTILGALVLVPLAIMSGCTGDTNTSSVTNPNPNPFQPKGTVSGVLTDSVTAAPIGNADVYIMDRHAVTGAQGQFTITNVPANTPVGTEAGAAGTDAYNVVIDMTNVNSALVAKNAAAVKYPAIAYTAVTVKYTSLGETSGGTGTGTNHDTPVDGFVANILPTIGKLDGGVKIQVVNKTTKQPVGGATVTLVSGPGVGLANTGNATTGNVHVIEQKSSDATTGIVTFSGIEAGKAFHVVAQKGNLVGNYDVFSGIDNVTLEYLNQQDMFTTTAGFPGLGPDGVNDALEISSVDTVPPVVIANTPANLSDIAAGVTTVKFTFSEPIKATGYALAVTDAGSTAGGLWKDLVVNFLGPKVGNVVYTAKWLTSADDATITQEMTVLAVTLTTNAASKYSVSIAGTALVDNSNNALAASAKNTVTFTTSGGATVTAPVVTRTTDTTVDWATVSNAFQYRVKVETFVNGLSTGVSAYSTSDTHFDVTTVPDFIGFTSNQVPVTYTVTVIAMATSNVESAGATGNVITLNDTAKPSVAVFADPAFTAVTGNALVPGLATDFDTRTVDYTFNVSYTEVMNRSFILNTANWGISKAAAVAATADHAAITAFAANATPALDILPTVKSVKNPSNDGMNFVVTVTFHQNATKNASTDMDAIQIAVPGTDVNGNVLKKSTWVGQVGLY
jgi:hypothetical protein